MKLLKFMIGLTCLWLSLNTLAKQSTLEITTAAWNPYINAERQTLGSAARLLEQVYSQNSTLINWRYQNYDLAYRQVARNIHTVSFPYFKTPKRATEVLYSDPVFSVSSQIYYNRQYNQDIVTPEINNFRIGRVAGYSYGTEVDKLVSKARIYSDEALALNALLTNEIDYLPMTQSVMNELLNTQFHSQSLLLQPISNIQGSATMHVIASNNAKGKTVIAQLNKLLADSADLQSLNLTPTILKQTPDIAQLISAEGYPAILGQDSLTEEANYFALPQGSRVLVLKWSDKMLAASKSDRLYKTMIDLSLVVVLSGPHVGRELYIRNMHINLL